MMMAVICNPNYICVVFDRETSDVDTLTLKMRGYICEFFIISHMETFQEAKSVIEPVVTEDEWGTKRALSEEEYTLQDGTSIWINDTDRYDTTYIHMCLDKRWVIGRIDNDEHVTMVRDAITTSD